MHLFKFYDIFTMINLLNWGIFFKSLLISLSAGTALLLVASYTSLSVLDPTNPVFGQDKKNKKEISDPSFEHVREYVLIDLEKVSNFLFPLTADVQFNEAGLSYLD